METVFVIVFVIIFVTCYCFGPKYEQAVVARWLRSTFLTEGPYTTAGSDQQMSVLSLKFKPSLIGESPGL